MRRAINEFLQKSGLRSPLLIVGLLVLSILTAYAWEVRARARSAHP